MRSLLLVCLFPHGIANFRENFVVCCLQAESNRLTIVTTTSQYFSITSPAPSCQNMPNLTIEKNCEVVVLDLQKEYHMAPCKKTAHLGTNSSAGVETIAESSIQHKVEAKNVAMGFLFSIEPNSGQPHLSTVLR